MSKNTSIPVTVSHTGKASKQFRISQGVYTLGSDPDNKIVLPGENVSWRHAILSLTAEGCWVEDLGSPAGTLLQGKPVQGRQAVPTGGTLEIGSYRIKLNGLSRSSEPAPPPPPPRQSAAHRPQPSAADDVLQSLKAQIHEELLQRLDIKRLTASNIDQLDLHERVQQTLTHLIQEVEEKLPPGILAHDLQKSVYDEALGLGPLEDFLADPDITEIMVNGPNSIYVEKQGSLELSHATFSSEDAVTAVIERIVAPIGRRIDESQPYVDARLPDGSRVNAIISPLSLVGPCLTIRKFSKEPFTIEDLIRFGSITREAASFIDICVRLRKNIVVAGGTGTGKTTLLNVISSYLPESERIITIEDAAELRLHQHHVIRLETRPPNIEGRGAINIRDLVRNALRMRPDRIVVGECRGGEALDMLQAMNTGHEGSLTTVHANSPRDVISRLETMVLMSGMELPLKAIREQIGSAIHLVVQIARYSDGSRRVSKITEIVGLEGDKITMQDLFSFTQEGLDDNGNVIGHFGPTGSVPSFFDEIRSRGIQIDPALFDPNPADP